MDLNLWARRNRPPATMMVIDGHEQLRCLAPALYDLEDGGYTILIAYPQPHLATPFPRTFTNQWFWDALLSYKLEPTTTTTILVNKCNDYPWSCSVCFVAAPSFEDFTTHLKNGTGMLVNTTLIVLTVITCRLVDHRSWTCCLVKICLDVKRFLVKRAGEVVVALGLNSDLTVNPTQVDFSFPFTFHLM
ncbi:uncharacterized protein LOC103844221 isoform X3 [Brassica rapa]|nr:uncharacterized protein LOC103844221 isoform X3 [Brassica rapa]XP_033138206.1 uncharacterized protein LOC103844221 isoform X3 [Brassica rapa]